VPSFSLFEVLRVGMGGVDMAVIGTCLPSVMAQDLERVIAQLVTKCRQDGEAGCSVSLEHYPHLVLEFLSKTTVASAGESNAHDCSALIDKI
jgi:hypothetical protein